MNAQRTLTLTFSFSEIVAALQAANPTSIHIQSLPLTGGGGVTVEATGAKGLTIKYTTVVGLEEPKAPLLAISGPR